MYYSQVSKVVSYDLDDFITESYVEKHYEKEAEFYYMFSALATFFILKWVVHLNFELALVLSFVSILFWSELFTNNFRFVVFFFFAEILLCVYYYKIGPYLATRFQINWLDPMNQTNVSWVARFLCSICWIGLSIGILIGAGILFFFPSLFIPEQMPPSIHCFFLWGVLSFGKTAHFFFCYVFIYMFIALWLFDALYVILFLLVAAIIFIIVSSIKYSEAVNISWDLYAFRNQVLLFFNESYSLMNVSLWESTRDAFGNVENSDELETVERKVLAWVTLASCYANRKGIMRNAKQCIRWCNKIINSAQSNHIVNAYLSGKGRINLYLAHMFLYVIYSRSTEYKSETLAAEHYKQFDHNEIDISEEWGDWDDPNCPFEDRGATRFEGIDFVKLRKIAKKEPDAYLTLHLICERFGRFWGIYNKNNLKQDIYEEYTELARKYLERGIKEGSRVCIEYAQSAKTT